MSTVQVAHDDPELERIISKITCQSCNGGAEGHLCHDDGTMIPVRVATCDPKGSIVSFGLRGGSEQQAAWLVQPSKRSQTQVHQRQHRPALDRKRELRVATAPLISLY